MSGGFENLKKSRGTKLDDLVQRSLDDLKDDREVQYQKLTKRQRIETSLLWSEDSDCHTIRGKMENFLLS